MANSNLSEKLDIGLIMALRAYEENPEIGLEDDAISVGLRFEGDLHAIEALGFETHSVSGEEARGMVRFKDVGKIAAHPGVLRIAAGRPRQADLEIGPKDIRARASSAANVGTDGLWHAADATSPLTSVANATGAGVFVAVIDTGIDYTHPMFMSQIAPAKVTRIFRIWDQGLPPASVAECPPVALLQSLNTYGVEFKPAAINPALNGGAALAHRDCNGHGTHVAGIAAGGIKTGAIVGGDITKVGVAPEAELIVVKFLDNPSPVRFRLAAGFGGQVGEDDRLKDAILYCLRTARAEGKSIVINMSLGNDHVAGDALDASARWVDALMDPSQPAGPLHFPQGAIIVKAAGNQGNVARRVTAHIVVPAGGTITVPLEVKDDHGVVHTKFKTCLNRLHSPTLFASFWYRRNFDNVKFAVKLPHRTTFTADMGVGGNFDDGLIVRPGPPPSLAFVPITPQVHRVEFRHGGNDAVPHPSGGTVRRHEALLMVTPRVSGGAVSYLEGIYEVKITAPAGTELFLMGDRESWGGAGLIAALRVATTMADGSPLHPAVVAAITPEFTATDTLGRHAITVAAYDDRNTVGGADHPIAPFSGRGPLRDFADPPGSRPLVATKPDLAAPGLDINSAQGVDTNVGIGIRVAPWTDGVRFISLQGTSQAAPMVAGVVALMLQKVPTLNTTDVRNHLTTGAVGRPGNNPAPPGTAHERAYGSGMLAARESHNAT